MDFEKCRMLYNQYQYHTGSFHCLKNHLCCIYVILLLPEALKTTDTLTVSIVLSFPECHVTGIIHYVALSD